jgi:hypothetical protein
MAAFDIIKFSIRVGNSGGFVTTAAYFLSE